MSREFDARIRRVLAKYPEGLSTAEVASLTGAHSKTRCEFALQTMRDAVVDRWVDACTPVWLLADVPADCPRPDGTLLPRTHGLFTPAAVSAAVAAAVPPSGLGVEWTKWHGGKRPVAATLRVVIIQRCGATDVKPASGFDWLHEGNASDIVAYRVASD